MRTIRLRERRTSTLRLRRADVDHLLACHRQHIDLVPTTERSWYRLTPRGWVGVLHAPHSRLLIEPKIPLSSLSFLLDPDMRLLDSPAGRGIDHWLSVVFARRLGALLAERAALGLHAEYVEEQAAGTLLRGRLDVAAQQRETVRGGVRLHGIAERRATDVPVNQAVRAVAERLMQSVLLNGEARDELRRALLGWEEVTPAPTPLPPLLAGAIPPGYRPLLEWCRLIEEAGGSGAAPGADVLVNLESAFERHLTRGIQEACAGSAVAAGVQTWHYTTPAGFAFHPDVTLSVAGRVVAAVDAKWKVLAADALDADDVHQVLAYAAALGAVRAVLVYPGRRNRVWAYHLPDGPIRLEVRTLDVAGPPERCQRSLRRLARALVRCP